MRRGISSFVATLLLMVRRCFTHEMSFAEKVENCLESNLPPGEI